MARELKQQVIERLPRQKVELVKTKYAGHAEKLAYRIAKKSKRPLLISSSGDGGYNELINGVMRAQNEGYTVVTAILPAGNANDHHSNLHTDNIVDQIVTGRTHNIDLLRLTAASKRKQIERYAHSYIGFGFTPQIAEKLNQTELNRWKEFWLVTQALFRIKSVRLEIDGKVGRYKSIIFSNIDVMSKYLKISRPSSVTDGKCEVTIIKKTGKFKFILELLKISLIGSTEDAKVSDFSLRTIRKTTAQLDGELLKIAARSKIIISVERQTLTCLL